MTRMWMRALLLGALLLTCLNVVGCAQERAPINQVQADALAKSFFVGPNLADMSTSPEFYMRGTIVDVGYGAAQDGLFTSTYAQPLSRIRWEITENYLNARLSYERIADTDGKGNLIEGAVKKTTNDGQIVAAYKIQSHFDIQRAYNPTTGEELNIVVENTTDRPWYQREYFRVDWSQNLAADSYDFDTLTALGWIGGIQYLPLAYTVLDPNNPDAPHWDAANGYFDVTVKAFATPAADRPLLARLGHQQDPRLPAPRQLRRRLGAVRRLQPGGDHAPLLVQASRRQGLPAGELRRLPLPGVRHLHHPAHRLRPRTTA